MNTIAFDRPQDAWGDYGEPRGHEPLPPRPRRRFLNRWTAALIALLTAAGGFYAGVRVEKGQLGSSTTGAASLAGRFAALRAGASGAGATAAGGGLGRSTGAGGGGFASRFGAGATVGSISSVRGHTIYVTAASGDVVAVRITSATKVTKSEAVSLGDLNPGNTVIVEGLKQANGTISATSVSDTGATGAFGAFTGAGTGGTGGTGAAGGSSPVGTSVGSLFSSGG